MDMQKQGPRGRSSSINPGPGAAVECKTLGVVRGGCCCLELTDALLFHMSRFLLLIIPYLESFSAKKGFSIRSILCFLTCCSWAPFFIEKGTLPHKIHFVTLLALFLSILFEKTLTSPCQLFSTCYFPFFDSILY